MNYINHFSHVNENKFVATFSAIEMLSFSNVPECYREKLLLSLRKYAKEKINDRNNFAYLSFYDEYEKDRSYPKLSQVQYSYYPSLFSCDSSETTFSILFKKVTENSDLFKTKENLSNWVLVPRIVVIGENGVYYPITPFKEYDECPAGEPRLVGFDFYFNKIEHPEISEE